MYPTKKLWEICEILDKFRKPVTSSDRKKWIYPYYWATWIQDFVDSYIFDDELVLIWEDWAKWWNWCKTAFKISGKTWVNNHAHVLKTKSDILLDNWLIYFINFSNLEWYITWATVKKLNQEKLKQIPIPLPPLPIQQKIVFKLDSLFKNLDQAITLPKQNLANIEGLNKSILEKIFKECEGKYEKKKLEEVCEIWPKKSELNNLDWKLEVAFVPMKYLNEKEKFFEYEEVKILDEVRWWYTYFTENDVLLAKVTPCFENWKSWIAKNLLNKIWFGSSEFYVFRANEKILPEWIYYIITSENFLKNWKNNMSGAVWLKRVTKNFIENFQIPLPPLSEQQKIVEYLDNIFAKNKILQEKYKQDLKNFEELKQSILKQAFEDEDFIK